MLSERYEVLATVGVDCRFKVAQMLRTLHAWPGGSGKVREVHSHATSQQAQSLATKENDQFLIKVYSQADVVCI